jgi:hypothetical protein
MPVGEYQRAFGYLGLTAIGRRESTIGKARAPTFFELRRERLIELHLAAEDFCDRGLGKIVARRAETASRYYGASSFEGFAHGLGDLLCFITDSRATDYLDAARRESAGDVRRIGVDREAQEELVTNGDQLDLERAQKAKTPA